MKLRILVALALIAIPRFAFAQKDDSECWQVCLDKYVHDQKPDPQAMDLVLHADEMTDSQLELMTQSAMPGGVPEWAKTQLANRMNDEWTVAWMLSFRVYKDISPSERNELEKEVIRRYFAVGTNPNLEETLLSHVSKENCSAVIQDYINRFPEKGGTPLALYNQFLAIDRYRGKPSPIACSEVLLDTVVPMVINATTDPEKLIQITRTTQDWDKFNLANQVAQKAIAGIEGDYFIQICQHDAGIESFIQSRITTGMISDPQKPYSQDFLQEMKFSCYENYNLYEYAMIGELKSLLKENGKKLENLEKQRHVRWDRMWDKLKPPPTTAAKKETRN